MKAELLREYVQCGRELEFKHKGKMFSINYGIVNGREVISFCEFNHDSIEVSTFEELTAIKYQGTTLMDMWNNFTDDDLWVY